MVQLRGRERLTASGSAGWGGSGGRGASVGVGAPRPPPLGIGGAGGRGCRSAWGMGFGDDQTEKLSCGDFGLSLLCSLFLELGHFLFEVREESVVLLVVVDFAAGLRDLPLEFGEPHADEVLGHEVDDSRGHRHVHIEAEQELQVDLVGCHVLDRHPSCDAHLHCACGGGGAGGVDAVESLLVVLHAADDSLVVLEVVAARHVETTLAI
mmetsp:Transcript_12328/g.23906  ORF Transcript_12328/g.23906 Transcript_12328/m.23906 type:complete len:209 (-) Transcript_12328:915-1541(-)